MIDSVRIEITRADGTPGGMLSGVLYPEIPAMLREIYERGEHAIVYDRETRAPVGGVDTNGIYTRSRPPLTGLRNKTGVRSTNAP